MKKAAPKCSLLHNPHYAANGHTKPILFTLLYHRSRENSNSLAKESMILRDIVEAKQHK